MIIYDTNKWLQRLFDSGYDGLQHHKIKKKACSVIDPCREIMSALWGKLSLK